MAVCPDSRVEPRYRGSNPVQSRLYGAVVNRSSPIIRLLLWEANDTMCRRGCPRVLIAHFSRAPGCGQFSGQRRPVVDRGIIPSRWPSLR